MFVFSQFICILTRQLTKITHTIKEYKHLKSIRKAEVPYSHSNNKENSYLKIDECSK